MSVYKSPYFGTGQELDEALLKVKNSDAEAWATGQRNGVDVASTDETYQNNAKYYAERMAQEPLIGTTDELTPTQVYDAVSAGIPVKVQYMDATSGLLSYTNFNVVENMQAIVANTIVYYNYSYSIGELIGDTDINEWSFISTTLAQKTDIPTALPNPNALTFTGAVEATYDGSNAVSVEIPEGGGSGASYSGFELIVDHTITADEASAASITFTKDTYPLINSQKLLIVEIQKPASVSTPWFAVKAGTVEAISPKEGTWGYYRMVADASNGVWTQAYKSGSNIAIADDLSPGYILSGAASIGNKNKAFADYTSISLVSYKAFFEENTTVKIWGGKV